MIRLGLSRLARQVVDADALHCPHCGVKRRYDRSTFPAFDQITDQIEAGHVSRTRLIEHRAVAIEGNSQCVQEVGRRRASERKYYAIKETSWLFRFNKANARSSGLILDFFDV